MSTDPDSDDKASRTMWCIQQTGKDPKCNGQLCWPYVFTRFVLFFNDCDSSSGITNLRPTYGTIPIRLKMNTFCFKKIDGLPAKF